MSQVTCGFCHTRFEEDSGQPTCGACPLKGGCSFVRCPECGYENPTTPEWMTKLRSWLRTDAAERFGAEAAPDDAQPTVGVP